MKLYAHRVAMVDAGFKKELLNGSPRQSNNGNRNLECSHLCHRNNCQKAGSHIILERN